MTVDTFPTYGVEPSPPPALPARSRLYPLAPLGLGTPFVESLTSYLTRLAHAHGVTVETLAAAEIAPLVDKSAAAARNKFSIESHHLNGLEGWTTLTLAALATLTRRHDLAFLTMHPWRQVLALQNLLRPHLAWCPACYSQWQQAGQIVYIPLVWTLKPGLLCPQHQQPLCDRCPYPDCGRQLRLINSRVKLGYCPYCRRWLGLTAESSLALNAAPGEVERQRQHWLTDQLARLLAASPTLAVRAEQSLFARNFKRCVAASAPGSMQGLAQAMGLSPSAFFGWIHRRHPPQLGLLARVCHQLDVSVLDMLIAQPGQTDDPLPPEASSPPPARTTVETGALGRHLAHLLAAPHAAPGSAARVARQLGISPVSIKAHCPEQYQQILQRNKQQQQAGRQLRNEKLADDLQAILDTQETPPPSMIEVAHRLHINPRTARANCPELCRAISHRRKTFYETRDAQVEAGLREILATDESPPPSISQVATRLHQKIDYLYRKFPALCQAVTQRYHHYQPPPVRDRLPKTTSPTPKAKDHLQLQRQFLALLAAETVPPLSLAEISRRLGCSISLLRQKFPGLCQQLGQQRRVYRQWWKARLVDRLRQILAAPESPSPSVRDVAARLEVDPASLKKQLPALYAEVVRRHQAERQAERHRRQAYLDQLLADPPAQAPSLSQVANRLGCSPSTLQRQFPEKSRIIIDRYRVYRDQELVTARTALEAALGQTPPLLPIQVARQLGYDHKRYLQSCFPELCHQLFQRYEAYRRQVARAQLEVVLAEPCLEPVSLVTVSRQLGYHLNSLKHLCPDLCQIIEHRYLTYQQHKKQAAKAALEAILKGERPPISVTALAGEFGYSLVMIQRRFPELTQAVSARYKSYVRERGEQRRQQLDEQVKQITRTLFEQGIDPKLHRVISRLAAPGAAKARHVRRAWQATRQALGLAT